MSEKQQSTMQVLNTAKSNEVAGLSITRERFLKMYAIIHGSEKAEMVYQTEAFHFNKIVSESPELQKCTALSLYGCILDIAVQGLSLDPNKKLAYLVPYNFNAGTKDNPKWVGKAQLHISGLGELSLRMRCGQIRHADNPVIVYDCDIFSPESDSSGKLNIHYEPKFPRPDDAQIIASYITITRLDGTTDIKIFSKQEIDTLRAQSKKPNGPAWVNNYTGMMIAKTIKHAFKTYPKVDLMGKFSALETEKLEDEIDYGFDEFEEIEADTQTGEILNPVPAAIPAAVQAPNPSQAPKEPDTF